jgi:hypothetical protein
MISLFPEKQHFRLLVHPEPNYSTTGQVDVEVVSDSDLPETQVRPMDWESVYMALATSLNQNEHQLAAMAKGLDVGRTLRFELDCRRSDLERAGFLSAPSTDERKVRI